MNSNKLCIWRIEIHQNSFVECILGSFTDLWTIYLLPVFNGKSILFLDFSFQSNFEQLTVWTD